jgi:hypothetical protein
MIMRTAGKAAEQAALEANSRRLHGELSHKLHRFEWRYEITSERMEEELKAGRLRETSDVADWIVTIRAFQRLRNGKQTAR